MLATAGDGDDAAGSGACANELPAVIFQVDRQFAAVDLVKAIVGLTLMDRWGSTPWVDAPARL